MFIDLVKIQTKAGDGGDGAVAFHREKYVARGGPSGGDGGRGGSVIFTVDEGSNTLLSFRYRRKFAAANGGAGRPEKRHGPNGGDVIIPVPPGTLIRDAGSGRILRDMSDGEPFVCCRGGRGGWGNTRFATPTRQTPTFAKSGAKGEERELILELKMLADVGLVGLPNAGKSSILARISAAKPKIADYPFTTLSPNLGIVDMQKVGYVKTDITPPSSDSSALNPPSFAIADIPGLIEGAAGGAGLGIDFLRHIERCRLLIHVVDVSGADGVEPLDAVGIIGAELEQYSTELAARPRIIAANKCDAIAFDVAADGDANGGNAGADDNTNGGNAGTDDSTNGGNAGAIVSLEKYARERGWDFVLVSAATGRGLPELVGLASARLAALPRMTIYSPEVTPDELMLEETVAAAVSETTLRIEEGVFILEGGWLYNLVERVNFRDREQLAYFQRSLRRGGAVKVLEDAGVADGDTVSIYGVEFDYVK